MRRTLSRKGRSKKSEDGKEITTSLSHKDSTKKSSSDDCILSRKYFNDTIPEEAVRSTLPSELAEEYLSFVQQCGRRKRKDDVFSKRKEKSEKKLAHMPQCGDGSKPTADHKENLPVAEEIPKPESAKKGRRREGRRRKNTVKNLLKCLVCSEEFPTMQKKQDHYSDHLGPRGYECTFCAKAFDKMPALVCHVSRTHLIDKKLACKICGKEFRREWLLRSHSLTHTSGRKFSCPTCKMGFTHKRHLFEHISGHVGFNPYKCEECGKRFQKSSYLSLHRRIHWSVRPFKCQFCNIQCSSYSAIKIHKLLHSENIGFECVDCNIKVPSGMENTHLISHSRKKNYICKLCPARFHVKSTLEDHVKAHSCIKEYKCDVCEKVMKTMKECSEHICPKWQRSVNVELCSFCETYIKKDCIEDHKTLCHEKPNPENSNVGNEDELWDESGESITVETSNSNGISVKCNGDEYGYSSSDYISDETDEDVGECIESGENPLVLDTVSERELLNLDSGLVQKIKQMQSNVEEETDEDEDDFEYCNC